MRILTLIIIFVILIWTFMYTISYGIFIWKQKNKTGGIAVMLISLAVLLLPILTIILRS